MCLLAGTIEELKAEQFNKNLNWNICELLPWENDMSLLKHVFVNLMSNAIKYSLLYDKGAVFGQRLK